MSQDVSIMSFSSSQFYLAQAWAYRSTALGCRGSRSTWSILPLTHIITLENQSLGAQGRGLLPIIDYTGRLRPERGAIFGIQVYEDVR